MKINALKNNNHLTLILGNKHYQFLDEKAESVFELALQYKKNKTDENLQALEDKIAKINRVRHLGLIDEDGNGNFYLKDYPNVQMPNDLAEMMIDHLSNEYPVDSFINFWKLCMANPNKNARDGFFKYIKDFGVTITDKGYAILYKSVKKRKEANDELVNFVSQQYTKIKRWKKAPSKYAVIDLKKTEQNIEDGRYELIDCYGENSPNPDELGTSLGDLQTLHDNLDDLIEETDSYFVPHHSGGDYGNEIKLGKPVIMPRDKCDPDINNACSYGLHVGARQYVKSFGGSNKIVLAVLVNPMNIVALPQYDHSKIRTCEYYPYAVLARESETWEEIEGGYFEEDYSNYEEEHLEELLSRIESTEQELEEEETKEYKGKLIDIYQLKGKQEDTRTEYQKSLDLE